MDQETRDALVSADPRSAELLKPVLRGRDIARYRANWAGLWLIDTHNGYAGVPPVQIDDYPAIKAHLDRFIGHLRRRQDKGVTPYNLRNCAYHADFAQDKVVWIELVDKGRFAFDDTGMFVEATTFMLTGVETKSLCALLNSTLAHWYIRKTAPTSGMGTSRWKKVYVESIPLVTANTDLTILSQLVDEARNCKEPSALVQFEQQIDSIVFQAYGISSEEASIIKLSTQF